MFAALFVDLADNGCLTGGFTAAGRAGSQKQAAAPAGQFLNHRRQAQFLDCWYERGNQAESAGKIASLPIDVDAETRDPAHGVRTVQLQLSLKPLNLIIGEDIVENPLSYWSGQRIVAGHLQLAVNS